MIKTKFTDYNECTAEKGEILTVDNVISTQQVEITYDGEDGSRFT